jgi:RimJ/RimL family protein N-acetyltransferase
MPLVLRPTFALETERLLLRPFADGDLEALLAMQGRPDVVRYLDWEPMSRDTVQSLLDRIKPFTAIDDRSDGLRLAALLQGSGELIGDVSLWCEAGNRQQAEIGFVLHPDFQGHGYASEAMSLLVRLGFEELGLHRIIGRCDARNISSSQLMERLGMRREAHFRESELIKGEWCDELIYAILANEWRATQGAR